MIVFEFIKNYLSEAFFLFFGGFVKWFFDKQKEKVSIKTTEIDNDVKLSNHYKDILDDLKSRYEDRYKEFEELMNRKIKLLEEENKLKDRKIKLQQQEINELKKENKALKANLKSIINESH